MVGTISMILALNDSLILSGQDLGSRFFSHFSTQPGRKYLCVAAPTTVDLTRSRVLPCVVAGKVPMHAPDTFHPSRWGRILVSSLTDGSLIVCELTDYSPKMPVYKGEAGESPRKKISRNDENSPTFDYPCLRKELALGTDVPVHNGIYTIGVISGDILSEFQDVKITGGATASTIVSDTVSGIRSKTDAHAEYLFAKSPLSPPMPVDAGIVLSAVPKEKAEDGKPFLVYGSIRFKTQPRSSAGGPVGVHILVSGTDEPDLSHYTVSIPADMLHVDNGTIVGHFAFDCMKEFFYKEGGRFDVPAHILVSAISGDLHTGPLLVKTGR